MDDIKGAIQLVERIARTSPYHVRQERVMFNEIWTLKYCGFCYGDDGRVAGKVEHAHDCIWLEAKRLMGG